MTKLETETVINFNDSEQQAWVATRQRRIKTIMQKLGIEPVRKQGDYSCYLLPKKYIKISPPRKVSDEQREKARERAKKFGFKPKHKESESAS